MPRQSPLISALLCVAALSSCSDNPTTVTVESAEEAAMPASQPFKATDPASVRTAEYRVERNAYFGDLHVHTMYSFDAFIFGTTSSPDDAYEFAKGGSITHPAGFNMSLQTPLDFYGVTDHAFYLGVLREMADPDSELSKHPVAVGMDLSLIHI